MKSSIMPPGWMRAKVEKEVRESVRAKYQDALKQAPLSGRKVLEERMKAEIKTALADARAKETKAMESQSFVRW